MAFEKKIFFIGILAVTAVLFSVLCLLPFLYIPQCEGHRRRNTWNAYRCTLLAMQLATQDDGFLELAGTPTEYIARLRLGVSLPILVTLLYPCYLVPKRSATYI